MSPEPELERRPLPQQPGPQPMPARGADASRLAGVPAKALGLAAVALLTAGFASVLVFRGGPNIPAVPPQQAQAAETALPQAAAPKPVPLAAAPADYALPPVPAGRHAGPAAADAEKREQIDRMVASLNTRVAEAVKKAAPEAKLDPPPSGWPAGATPPVDMNAIAPVDCPGCAEALPAGRGQANTLPTGTYFIEAKYDRNGIKQNFTGMCDGKYMYEFRNPAPKARQVSIITQQGETWSFNLAPGKSATVKSSTEFVGGSYSVSWR